MIDSRKSFTGALLEEAKKDKDLVVVTTDARGSVTLNEFADILPEQFVECGIAEQNAVGIAADCPTAARRSFAAARPAFM